MPQSPILESISTKIYRYIHKIIKCMLFIAHTPQNLNNMALTTFGVNMTPITQCFILPYRA